MNALVEMLGRDWAQRLGWALVHFLWQGTAIAGLLWVALRLLARRGPQARYLPACLAMLLMAAAPAVTFMAVSPAPAPAAPQAKVTPIFEDGKDIAVGLRVDFGQVPVDIDRLRPEHLRVVEHKHPLRGDITDSMAVQRPSADHAIELRFRQGYGDFGSGNTVTVSADPSLPLATGGQLGTPLNLTCDTDRSAAAAQPAAIPPPATGLGAAAAWLTPALPYAVAVWLAGVVVCSVWHLGGWAKVQRLRRAGLALSGEGAEAVWLAAAGRLGRAFGIRGRVALLKVAELAGPVVAGVLRPAVLIPAALLAGLTPAQVEAILAHELAHIRRHDYLVNLLQTLVETALFYHPAAWWVSGRIRAEREHCCDDLAVAACGDRTGYARALLALAESRPAAARAMVAASGGRLVTRIRRILGLSDSQSTPARWLAGLVIMAGVLAAAIPIAVMWAAGASDKKESVSQPATQPTALSLKQRREMLIAAVNADPPDLKKAGAALMDVGNAEVVFEKGPLDSKPDQAGLPAGVSVDTRDGKPYLHYRDAMNRTANGPAPQEWLDRLLATRKDGFVLEDVQLAIAPDEETRRQRDKLLAQADAQIRKGLLAMVKDYPRLAQTRDGALAKQLAGKSRDGGLFIAVVLTDMPGDGLTKIAPGITIILGPLHFHGHENLPQMAFVQLPGLENLALMGQINSKTGDPKLDAAAMKVINDALAPLKELNKKAALGSAAPASASAPASRAVTKWPEGDEAFLKAAGEKLTADVGHKWEVSDKPRERGLTLWADFSKGPGSMFTAYIVYPLPWTAPSKAQWDSSRAAVIYEAIASSGRCTLMLTGEEDKDISGKIIEALGLRRLSRQESLSPPATSQSAADTAEIDRLITELGSNEFTQREAAQKALVKIGRPAVPALKAAKASKDAEQAGRVRAALQEIAESALSEKTAEATKLQYQLKDLTDQRKQLSAMLLKLAAAGRAGQEEAKLQADLVRVDADIEKIYEKAIELLPEPAPVTSSLPATRAVSTTRPTTTRPLTMADVLTTRPAPTIKGLAERSRPEVMGKDAEDSFWDILKLRDLADPKAVPELVEVLTSNAGVGRIHGYAAAQALFCIGSKEATAALDQHLTRLEEYSEQLGSSYAFHWDMSEPARSRYIAKYWLRPIGKDLDLSLEAKPQADGSVEFTGTLKNVSEKTLDVLDPPIVRLYLSGKDGRFLVVQPTGIKEDGLSTGWGWKSLKPGDTQILREVGKLKPAAEIRKDFPQIPEDVQAILSIPAEHYYITQPGQHDAVFVLEQVPYSDQAKKTLKAENPWVGRAVSKPIVVQLGSPATQPASSPASAPTTKVAFDTLTISVSPTIWRGAAKVTIKPDGSGTFETDSWGDRGGPKTAWKQIDLRLDPQQVRKLEAALAASEWLGAKPLSERVATDAPEYTFKLTRNGREQEVKAWSSRDEAYKDLVAFSKSLVESERQRGATLPAGQPATKPATRPGTDADRAKLINWVEDYVNKNSRDFTARKLIEWGQAEKTADGNLAIRHKYKEIVPGGKEELVIDQRFTFTPDGKFVTVETIEKGPAATTSPATRPAADAAEIDRLIKQLEAEAYKQREEAQTKLVTIGESALPALRKAAGEKDSERSVRARNALAQIINAPLAKWLEDKEVVEISFVGPKMDLQQLRQSVKSAPGEQADCYLSPGEGGGVPGCFLTATMKVTPETTRTVLAVQAELEPRGYILDASRSRIWAYKGDEKLRGEARKLAPDVAAEVEKAIKAAYPKAEVAHDQAAERENLVALTYKLPGTNISGFFRITEIKSTEKHWDLPNGPEQELHLPRLALMVHAYWCNGQANDDWSPERKAFRKAVSESLAPLLKLEPGATLLERREPAGKPLPASQPAARPNAAGPAEIAVGEFLLDRKAPLSVRATVAGRPDLLTCTGISFKANKDAGPLYALVPMQWGAYRSCACAVRVELLDEKDTVIGFVERVFGRRLGGPSSNTGITGEQSFFMGPAGPLLKAKRFRLTVQPIKADVLASMEGAFELNQVVIDWLSEFQPGNDNRMELGQLEVLALDQGRATAKLVFQYQPVRDLSCIARVELMDAQGKALASGEATLALEAKAKDRAPINLEHGAYVRNGCEIDLGRVDLKAVTRYRLSLLQGVILPEEAAEFARLKKVLLSEDSLEARDAAIAMGKLKSPAVVDALVDAMGNASAQTAMGIGMALGNLKDPEAIPALMSLFDRADALKGLTPNPMNGNLASVAHWSLIAITSDKTDAKDRNREGMAMIPGAADAPEIRGRAALVAVRDAWRARLAATATTPASMPTTRPASYPASSPASRPANGNVSETEIKTGRVVQTYLLLGRKASMFADGRLVFYDGSGDDAKPAVEVDAKDQAVVVSRQGKYLALCAQFVDKKIRPVRIYDATGKKVGQFDLKADWKIDGFTFPFAPSVQAISDAGMISLLPGGVDAIPSLVRLCDFSGKVLAGGENEYAQAWFTRDGVPIVIGVEPLAVGADPKKRRFFVAILDAKGQMAAMYEPSTADMAIRHVEGAPDASIVAIAEGPHAENFADRLTVWQVAEKKRMTVELPKDLGVIQGPPSVSPKGAFIAVRLGATGVGIVKASDASFAWKKDLSGALRPDDRVILQVLSLKINDDGSATAQYLVQAQNGKFSLDVNLDKDGKAAVAMPATRPAADAAEIDRLVKQLGSDDFSQREAAEKRLIDIGRPALPALHAALKDGDAERARRASHAFFAVRRSIDRIGIYLVEGSSIREAEGLALDRLKLADEPLVGDDEIISYDWSKHVIKFTAEGVSRLPKAGRGVQDIPFVIVVDGQRCYLADFNFPISSYAPKVPRVLMWNLRDGEVAISSGSQGLNDPRGDDRLRKALQELGKLKGVLPTEPATKPATTRPETWPPVALTAEQEKERDKLLAQADEALRQGLKDLSKRFEQLAIANNQPLDEMLAKEHPRNGQISLWLGRSSKEMKVPWRPEQIADDQAWSLMAIIEPGRTDYADKAMATFPLYPHLGLVGLCSASAADAKLDAALKKLLADALSPVKAFDERLAKAKPATQTDTRPAASPYLTTEQVTKIITGPTPSFPGQGRGESGVRLYLGELEWRHADQPYKPVKADEPALLAVMNDDKLSVPQRLSAARFLLDLDNAQARQFVADCLDGKHYHAARDGSHPSNVEEATYVLAFQVRPETEWAIEQAIRVLKDDRLTDSSGALRYLQIMLGERKVRPATSALIDRLERHPDSGSTAGALGGLGDRAATDVLLKTLEADGKLRLPQAYALKNLLKPELAVPALLRHLDEGPPVFVLLAEIKDSRALAPVAEYAKAHPDNCPAQIAWVQLEAKDTDELCGRLAGLLKAQQEALAKGSTVARDNIVAIVTAMGQSRSQRVIEPVLALAKESQDSTVIRDCIWALGQIGGPPAVAALVDLLGRNFPQPSGKPTQSEPAQIVDQLNRVTGKDFGTDAKAWRAWLREHPQPWPTIRCGKRAILLPARVEGLVRQALAKPAATRLEIDPLVAEPTAYIDLDGQVYEWYGSILASKTPKNVRYWACLDLVPLWIVINASRAADDDDKLAAVIREWSNALEMTATPTTTSAPASQPATMPTSSSRRADAATSAEARLTERLSAIKPKGWNGGSVTRGKVEPKGWAAGEGMEFVWSTDPKVDRSGRIFVWIMDADYTGKMNEDAGYPAREIAKWRGRRVFYWYNGFVWPTATEDIQAALQATDSAPSSQPVTTASAPASRAAKAAVTDEEYETIMRRVFEKIVALEEQYPSLKGIQMPKPVKLGGDTSTLKFEYNTTWVRQDPAQPASKRNAELPVFGKGGYWFQLYFYKGRYEGAALFLPLEIGDLNLWLIQEGNDSGELAAIRKIISDEQDAFARAHPEFPVKKLPASRPTTQPAGAVGRVELDVKNFKVGLYDDDKAKPGLFAIGFYPRHDMYAFNTLYELAAAGKIPVGWNELIGRMEGAYLSADECEVAEYVLEPGGPDAKGGRITARIRYVRGQAADNQVKRGYVWAPLPQNLAPGKYQVTVELVEYLRENGKLVVAPKTAIRAFEHLICTFEVPPPASAPASRPAGGAEPPDGAKSQEAKARDLAARLSNSDIRWDGDWMGLFPQLAGQTAKALRDLGDSARPALLEALADPQKFAAAHVLLTAITDPKFGHGTADEWNGLRVTLTADNKTVIDPKQIPELVKRWQTSTAPTTAPAARPTVTGAEAKLLSAAFDTWLAGDDRGPWPTYKPGTLSPSKLDIAIFAERAEIVKVAARSELHKKDVDVLVLPLRIANRLAAKAQAELAHEWYGGEWPPTDLYVSVLRPGEDKAAFTPVFLAGETGEITKPTVIEPGKSVSLSPRLDWPGTGSVHGDPILSQPGVYKVQFLLVFEAEGKKQYVQSKPIAFDYRPTATPATQPTTQPADWHLVAKNELVSVHVQKALCDQGPESHFFIRVRVTNDSPRTIGVDLRKDAMVIWPNQWGDDLPSPQRGVINERRVHFGPMTQERKTQLNEAFKAGKLARLESGQSVEYYRDFNNSSGGRPLGGMYTIISLEGKLEMTDGLNATRVTCESDYAGKYVAEGVVDTDMYLPPDFKYARIPASALVITDDGISGTPTTIPAASQPASRPVGLAPASRLREAVYIENPSTMSSSR